MSTGTPILLERDNVNDDVVILSQWFVQNGEPVQEGTLIAEVETSKANVEVIAPKAGYLEWGIAEKSDISYEAPLGYIFDQPLTPDRVSIQEQSGESGDVAPLTFPALKTPVDFRLEKALETSLENPQAPVFSASTEYAQRFSRRAEELIHQHGLARDQFSGIRMVRALNVLRVLDGASPEAPDATARPSGQPVARTSALRDLPQSPPSPLKLPATEIPLSKMKRSEIHALEAGARNTIPSMVTVTCLTRGLRAALTRNPAVGGSVAAVIAYETSRLLRKYPMFNATYRPGKMMRYEQVNLGYAMDDGRGLKVAIIPDCDARSLAQIAEELRTLMLGYLDDKLSPSQISGGTFTISDLSGMDVAGFLPLISEGQGAILGVGAEQFLPGSRDGCYTLTLAFDHQLSEGRTAALFLNDLKDRLLQYEQAMSHQTQPDPACARCGRTSTELPDAKSFMIQSIVPPGYLCNLCVAGL